MKINKDNLIVKVKEKCLSFYYDDMPFFDLEGNHELDDSVKIVEAFFDFDITKDFYVFKNAFVEFDTGVRIENFDNVNFDQVISIKREQDLKAIAQTMGFHNKKKRTGKSAVSKNSNGYNHSWSDKDENYAFDFYKNKLTDFEIEQKLKELDLQMSFNSMKMKIANIKFLHTGEGMSNYSQKTKHILESRINELS